ncbi:stimulated by retinoic acid gene 6 protein-like isoform X2 [Xenia sp. Carnegie-2017]|uniref:stimulated by retinoic acid gene 6 protein-like isoform X2 n=1 Tax=Xenia sp. Carnegie-2017 TaxID=2897299 RepID=UPI001F0477B8|nr:stimulated by retinoic acid gene 6 protein-like isoform X2 [Xenia sp. Carnegie-2017]
MTTLIENFINITYDIRSSIANTSLLTNTTISDYVLRTIYDQYLLGILANRTALSPETIVTTVEAVYGSAVYLQAVYKQLQDGRVSSSINSFQSANTTCGGRFNSDNIIASAFTPAILMIILLSFVSRRVERRNCCNGRPGLAIPVNLLDSYEDRYTYSFAFAATASSIVQVIVDDDFSLILGNDFRTIQQDSPSYVKTLLRTATAIVIGISYYPFFACISTQQRLLGAILGTIYSTFWLITYLFQVIDCNGSGQLTEAELVVSKATTILFHGLLLLAFIRVLVRSTFSKRRGIVVSEDEWKENYKYKHVQNLLKQIPKSEDDLGDEKSSKKGLVSRIYEWKPDFKYSTRIVCIYITCCACLYMVMVLYIVAGRGLRKGLNEVIKVLEDTDDTAGGTTGVYWNRIKEGIDVTIICWYVAIAIATIKDIAIIANMLSWYRGHVLRLQKGETNFLPYNMDEQEPVDIMVASFKFGGYQAGYIIWSYKTYIGHLFLEHTHTNPVLFIFNRLMWEAVRNNGRNHGSMTEEIDVEGGETVSSGTASRRGKIRWHLALTLINNPELKDLRRKDEQKAEEAKGPGAFQQFKTKVVTKIEELRHNHDEKCHRKESKL